MAGRWRRWIWGVATVAILVAALAIPRYRLFIGGDEGLLGQAAERVLQGERPHLDFDDTYTGGQAYLHAAIFELAGSRSAYLRDVLLFFAALFLAAFFALAARFFGEAKAALLTLLATALSLPLYFAALPSWYNLFFAFFSLAALYLGLPARRGWLLFGAGAAAGVSILFKVVGFYTLGAGLMGIAYFELTRDQVDPDPSRAARAVDALRLTIGGLALGAALAGLGVLQGAWTPANLLVWWTPIAMAAALLVAAERRLAPAARPATLSRLARSAGAFGVGALLPPLAFAASYAGAPAGLEKLARGVFLLPRQRLGLAEAPLPPWPELLAAGAPLVLALAWLCWLGQRAPSRRGVRWAWAGVAAMLPAGTAALVAGAPGNYFFSVFDQGAFLLLPAASALATWRLARGQSDAELYLALAAAALFGLIVYPFATVHYRAYAAPLVLLLLGFLTLRRAPRAPGEPLLDDPVPRRDLLRAHGAGVAVAALLLYLFTARWQHPSSVFLLGYPRPQNVELREVLPERVGLWTTPRYQALYDRLAEAVRTLAPPGMPILALPDAPEVYFFSERSNPTRVFYDALADPLGAAELEALLPKVGLVVVQRQPPFSPPLDAARLAQIRRRFPERLELGPYELWYRRARP